MLVDGRMVFPLDVQLALDDSGAHGRGAPEFQLVHGGDESALRVRVEHEGDGAGLAAVLSERLGVAAEVETLEPGSLPRRRVQAAAHRAGNLRGTGEMGRRVLVTGASGVFGRDIVRRGSPRSGAGVVALAPPRSDDPRRRVRRRGHPRPCGRRAAR